MTKLENAVTIPLSGIDEIVEKFDAFDALMPIHAVHSAADHERAVRVLDALLDNGGAKRDMRFRRLWDDLESLSKLVNPKSCRFLFLPESVCFAFWWISMACNREILPRSEPRASARSGATANAS